MRSLLIALALTLAVDQWGQRLVVMACWGTGNDERMSNACETMANEVQACRDAASRVPTIKADQTFYDCLGEGQ